MKALKNQNAELTTENVIANKEVKKAIKAKKIVDPKAEIINNDLLMQLTAIGITDKVKKASEQRSIFKKEFNNKSDRTKCRTKFINAISLMLLNLAHNKFDLAKENFNSAKDLANKYYQAENKFNTYTDYCTENNEQKETIKMFISQVQANKDLFLIEA